jgi:hypothetical protein
LGSRRQVNPGLASVLSRLIFGISSILVGLSGLSSLFLLKRARPNGGGCAVLQ